MPIRDGRNPGARGQSLLSRRTLLERSALALGGVLLGRAGIEVAEAQVAGFSYFIAPNGSDANPGTLASPWAITTLLDPSSKYATAAGKANWAKVSGKTIGLLPGTYSLAGLCDSAVVPGNGPILNLPAGTAAANTVVASCSTSGVYQPLAATLDAGTVSGAGPYFYAPAIGSTTMRGNGGYITVAGLTVQNCNGSGIDFTYDPGVGSANNLVIRDNVVQGIITTVAGNNPGCIRGQTLVNSLVTNNLLYNFCVTSAEASSSDWIHIAAILMYFGNGTTYSYNTIYNTIPSSGIHLKGAGGSGSANDNRNSTIAYNFIQIPYTGSLGIVDFASTNTASVNYVNNNIVCADGGIMHGGVNTVDENTLSDTTYVYNNTLYSPLATLDSGWSQMGTNLAKGITWFNNIAYAPNVSNFGYLGNIVITNAALALSDYNCWPAPAATQKILMAGNFSQSNPGNWLLYPYGYTLSGWQAALGADQHSLAANPGFTPQPLSPTSYQLPANSPCAGAGRIGGVPSGGATDMGAWGGNALRIGYTAATPPNPPSQFSVS
jgi:hypothetical protein